MLRQFPQEDREEPAVDDDLRADFLRTIQAGSVVEEAEDPQADAFFYVDRVDRLRGSGRCGGRSSPTGGALARRRIRLGESPRRLNLPELLFRDDLVPRRQAADRESLRGPQVVGRQEDELSRSEGRDRREDAIRWPGMDARNEVPHTVEVLLRHEATQGPSARLAQRLVVEVCHVLRRDDHADAVLPRLTEQEG